MGDTSLPPSPKKRRGWPATPSKKHGPYCACPAVVLDIWEDQPRSPHRLGGGSLPTPPSSFLSAPTPPPQTNIFFCPPPHPYFSAPAPLRLTFLPAGVVLNIREGQLSLTFPGESCPQTRKQTPTCANPFSDLLGRPNSMPHITSRNDSQPTRNCNHHHTQLPNLERKRQLPNETYFAKEEHATLKEHSEKRRTIGKERKDKILHMKK